MSSLCPNPLYLHNCIASLDLGASARRCHDYTENGSKNTSVLKKLIFHQCQKNQYKTKRLKHPHFMKSQYYYQIC